MTIPKNYFRDRSVLLLLSFSTFVVVLSNVLILLRLDSGRGEGYIVQYRAIPGVNDFKTGDVTQVLSFIVLSLLVLVLHVALSMRVYHIRRHAAVTILGLGLLLLVMSFVVSNALLILR